MSWPMVKLGDAPLKISDGNYSAKYPKASEFLDSGIPFLSGFNIVDGEINEEGCKYISTELHAELKKGHIKTGDVLITTRGNIGNTAIVPERLDDANINAQLVLLRPETKHIDSSYLKHIFNSPDIKRQIDSGLTGSALKQLPIRSLNEIEIPLPPLAEQKRIAAILDKADAIRRKRQQAIQLADDFLRAVFLEMFGDPVTNPKGWEVAGFQHYCELNPKSQKLNDDLEVSFVPMQKVSEQSPLVDVTDIRTFAEVKKGFTAFAEGDVLFAKITPCMENGKAGIARNLRNGFGYGSTEFHVLRPFKPHYAEFLYSLVHLEVFRKHAANSFSGAVGHKRVPKDFFEKFALYKIPEELVLKFSQIFTETYKSISSCSSSLLELDDLFNSLSQKAFSGQL